jgi:hypothetical protein
MSLIGDWSSMALDLELLGLGAGLLDASLDLGA